MKKGLVLTDLLELCSYNELLILRLFAEQLFTVFLLVISIVSTFLTG